MTIEMQRYADQAAAFQATLAPLNGKRDAFDVLSTLQSDVEDVERLLDDGGFFGWNIHTIPLSGMDDTGFYDMPKNIAGIVGMIAGKPTVFGSASMDWKPIQVEQIVPLLHAIRQRGLKLVSAIPGPVATFVFEGEKVEVTPYAATNRRGDIVQDRIVVRLGNTGKTSLQTLHRPTRLACVNGMTTSSTMGVISIAHSSLAPTKIEKTVDLILGEGREWLKAWVEEARQTVVTSWSLDRALTAWSQLFNWNDEKQGRALSMQETQLARLTELWNAPTQQLFYPGTGWAFFNATAEYMDHERVVRFNGQTRQQALAAGVVGGATDGVKARAWAMALA